MNPKEDTSYQMGVFLNDDVLKSAREKIQAEEPEETIELELNEDSGTYVVSRSEKDVLALEKVEHNGVTYYIGVPK